jgi:hypothetical protein
MSQRKYGAAKTVDVFWSPNIWHGYGGSLRCRGHQALVQPVPNATPTSQHHHNAVTPPISHPFSGIAFKSSDLSGSVRQMIRLRSILPQNLFR